MAQLARNFSVDKLQHISAEAVFKIGYFSVLLDFEAAGGHLLLRSRSSPKYSPRDH